MTGLGADLDLLGRRRRPAEGRAGLFDRLFQDAGYTVEKLERLTPRGRRTGLFCSIAQDFSAVNA